MTPLLPVLQRFFPNERHPLKITMTDTGPIVLKRKPIAREGIKAILIHFSCERDVFFCDGPFAACRRCETRQEVFEIEQSVAHLVSFIPPDLYKGKAEKCSNKKTGKASERAGVCP